MTEQPVRLTRRVTIPAGTQVDIPVSMTLPVDSHVQVAPIPGRLQQLLLVPHSIQVFTKRGNDGRHQGC
jgi:sporulation-control protein spo0M